ncbi:hypothetical protein EV691_105176 [Azotobacter chroococcum]|uniref:Uncharacterized protein n=1 Tax=Azotobacter chroococcum TaxID=353 RepID=A0A4R1PRM1_9GAMM|nr:hypothetical protein EV691_105176 [Azotobacter chroococcum]
MPLHRFHGDVEGADDFLVGLSGGAQAQGLAFPFAEGERRLGAVVAAEAFAQDGEVAREVAAAHKPEEGLPSGTYDARQSGSRTLPGALLGRFTLTL